MVQKKGSVCIFFHGLPNCPSKMCLVMTRHILMLPMHKFFCLIIHVLGVCVCVYVSTQNLCLGIIHLFLKKTRADNKFFWKQTVQKVFVPSPIRIPFADFMPSFLGEMGPSFHSFIHSFIVQFLPYFLQRKTQMFFAYESGGFNFHSFSWMFF
jgi:hypothetical protein